MGMNVGGSKRAVRPNINVTPLVDVVLVLLIIFMVVTPLMLKQFKLSVPKKPDEAEQQAAEPDEPDDPPLVLSVRADGRIVLNNDDVKLENLVPKLRRVFAARSDHVLFFDAENDVPYARAAEVLDAARSGHAVTIAVVPEPLPRQN